MLNTSLDIKNHALLRLNQNTISSDADSSPQGQFLSLVYDQARCSLLSQYNWNFALKNAELQIYVGGLQAPTAEQLKQLSDKRRVATGFRNEFILPADFLRLVSLRNALGAPIVANPGGGPAFALEGRHLFSNESGLYLKYISDISNVSEFSPLFCDCLVIDLAIRMTKMFNDSTSYLQHLNQEFMLQMQKAKESDSRQTMLSGMQSYPLLGSRGGF